MNLFKAVTMSLYLKNEIGVAYDRESAGNFDYSNSRVIFLHGLLSGKKTGTCTSLPVLCAAIGRRLGYPIKLVQAKRHIFCRWDDGTEKFNLEICCPGADSPSDEYYQKGKYKLEPIELTRNVYLKSLTAVEELALFMASRAACLSDNKRFTEAQIARAWECHLMPSQTTSYLVLLSLADHNLRLAARRETKIAGQSITYGVPVNYSGKESFFIWKLPRKNTISPSKSLSDPDLAERLYQRSRRKKQLHSLYPNPTPVVPQPNLTGQR